MTTIPADILARAEVHVPRDAVSRSACLRYVALAIMFERDRCAYIADDFDQAPGDDTPMGPIMSSQVEMAQRIARAIRGGGAA